MIARAALVLALGLTACEPDRGAPVVFAAASTTDVVHVIADRRGADGHPVAVSVGASSTLAHQIARGAPADVFVTADPAWIDWLEEKGVSVLDRRSVARGRLVVVGPHSASPDTSFGLAVEGASRVALADPSHVPAGRYARAALEQAGLWERTAPHVIATGDVRAAMAAVETGAADRAIVYASDARASRRVRVLFAVPASAAPAIRYEVARLTRAGRRVADLLTDDASRSVWASAGFDPP